MQQVNSTKEAIDYINGMIDFLKADYDPTNQLFPGTANGIFAAIRVDEDGLPHDYVAHVDYSAEKDMISADDGKWVGRDQLTGIVTKALAGSNR